MSRWRREVALEEAKKVVRHGRIKATAHPAWAGWHVEVTWDGRVYTVPSGEWIACPLSDIEFEVEQ